MEEKSSSMNQNTASRVALITGGVRGIGRAVALALARRGWIVAVCYRKSEQEASTLEAELQAAAAQFMLVQSDISSAPDAENLVRGVEENYGRVDALINCAGSYHRVHLLQESVQGWREMFDNNLHPVFYLSRAVAPGMMRLKWGRIINFGMVNADQNTGQPYVTAHYISKIGVIVLTRSLAKVLAPHGITVNSISPGFIDTGGIPHEEISRWLQSIPAGYVGTPEDAVGAVLFLLSEEARYVNGANIQVSGAWGV